MAVAATKSRLTLTQILDHLAVLPPTQLNRVAEKVAELRLREHPNVLSPRETRLLEKINAGPPKGIHEAYRRLVEKRRSEGQTREEQAEVERLATRMEEYDVQRLEWLTELAGMRRTSVRALIASLGLKRPAYV